jgi:hypothetical protein
MLDRRLTDGSMSRDAREYVGPDFLKRHFRLLEGCNPASGVGE